jgi:hypothetical protein
MIPLKAAINLREIRRFENDTAAAPAYLHLRKAIGQNG